MLYLISNSSFDRLPRLGGADWKSVTETERTREYIRRKLLDAKEAGIQAIQLIARNITKRWVMDAMNSLGIIRTD